MVLVLTIIAAAVSGALLIAIVGLVSRSLLGWRLGTVRTVLAGLVGAAGWTAVSLALPRERPWAYIVLQIGVGVVSAMVFLGVAEAAAPSSSGPVVVRWRGAARRKAQRARRYVEVLRIARRHGLLGRPRWPADPEQRADLARAVRVALEEAGVTFVKLGQLLSTRPDLVPPELIDELSRLQSAAAPVPWSEVEPIIAREVGTGPGSPLASIDPEPAASASIAQVHRAVLRGDGGDGPGASPVAVAVKVRRPGIETAVLRDLDIVARLAAWLEARSRWARSVGAVDLAAGFAAAMREELDFTVEARNVAAVRASTDALDAVAVPCVHEALSGRDVLVTEWFDGVPLGAAPSLPSSPPGARTDLARVLLHCVLGQVLVHGTFHADPHPGNVVVLRDGGLGLLDFGSVGRLDRTTRGALARLLGAFDRGDAPAAVDALADVVVVEADADVAALERALGRFLAEHLGPGTPAADAAMFTALFRLVAEHGLVVPPQVAAVFRALTTLEGTLRALDPGFDVVEESRRFGRERLRAQFQPGAAWDAVERDLVPMLPLVGQLPRRALRITRKLERGELQVNVRLLADSRDRAFVRSVVHDLVVAVLAATAGLMAVVLLNSSSGPRFTDEISLNQLFGYHLLVVTGVLFVKLLAGRHRRTRHDG